MSSNFRLLRLDRIFLITSAIIGTVYGPDAWRYVQLEDKRVRTLMRAEDAASQQQNLDSVKTFAKNKAARRTRDSTIHAVDSVLALSGTFPQVRSGYGDREGEMTDTTYLDRNQRNGHIAFYKNDSLVARQVFLNDRLLTPRDVPFLQDYARQANREYFSNNAIDTTGFDRMRRLAATAPDRQMPVTETRIIGGVRTGKIVHYGNGLERAEIYAPNGDTLTRAFAVNGVTIGGQEHENLANLFFTEERRKLAVLQRRAAPQRQKIFMFNGDSALKAMGKEMQLQMKRLGLPPLPSLPQQRQKDRPQPE